MERKDEYPRIRIPDPRILHSYVLETEPVKGRKIRDLVGEKLRSRYPGTLTNEDFDFRILYRGKKGEGIAVAAFIMEEDDEDPGGGQKIIPGLFLLQNLLELSPHCSLGLLISDSWVEGVIPSEDDGRIKRYFFFERPRCFNLEQLSSLIPQEDPQISLVDISSSPDYYEGLKQQFPHSLSFPGSAIIKGALRKRQILRFPKKKGRLQQSIPLASILFALGSAALVLLLILQSYGNSRLMEIKREQGRRIGLINEVRRLKNELALVETGSPSRAVLNPYRILHDTAEAMEGCLINLLYMDHAKYSLEGEGEKPLQVLEVLSKSDQLRDLKLQDVRPQEKGGDLFTINGRIIHE